jgi:polyisoprenoid-binding protein YceI
MKTRILKLTAVTLIALITMSFTVIKKETKQIKTRESKVNWVGKKAIGSDHKGTINIQNGTLEFKKDKLIGGEISIDMNSITVTDLEGDYKNKLEGHLKADDFFGVDKFQTSKIVFTKIEGNDGKYKVTGDITIKGIIESITFDLDVKGNTATAKLDIDRTKFGIKYGSSSFFDNLKDKAIQNNFELNVHLVF